MNRQEIGARGEDAAEAYLRRSGLDVIDRNWRCPVGEIDIVAIEGESLVLCEVKTRTTIAKGTPEEAVSAAKRKRLTRLAEAYIANAGIQPCEVRFDVIAIRVLSPDRALLRHHRAAFQVE